MGDETTALLDRVRALLDAPVDASPPARARVEYTLTEGYARALALEAQRRRIEAEMASLTAALADGDGRLSELSALAQRRSRAESEISRLRAALSVLRERLRAATTAAALL